MLLVAGQLVEIPIPAGGKDILVEKDIRREIRHLPDDAVVGDEVQQYLAVRIEETGDLLQGDLDVPDMLEQPDHHDPVELPVKFPDGEILFDDAEAIAVERMTGLVLSGRDVIVLHLAQIECHHFAGRVMAQNMGR